jgi:peptidoglycan/LPS O-acetylase OafA/YrhL
LHGGASPRIAPLFVFTVVLTYVLHWTAWRQFAVVSMSTRHFLETLLLWEGRGIFWTIPVEVQFYFVFPLIWWISAKAPRLWMPLTIIAGISGSARLRRCLHGGHPPLVAEG